MFANQSAPESVTHEVALGCVRAGIEAAHPKNVVRDAVDFTDGELTVCGTGYDVSAVDDVLVAGGGNAAGPAVEALEAELGDAIDGGAVVTDAAADAERVELLAGDHPVPSQRGMENTQRVLEVARGAGEDDLVLAVVTGGGSALLAAPVSDVALSELQRVTTALLESGATIHEINAVRKHLSTIKGGQLARAISPARFVGLVFSDVVGNDLGVVASGPTAPDDATFERALAVLDAYDIAAPDAVRDYLDRGASGAVRETPDPASPVFETGTNHVLADGNTALQAAAEAARERGYRTLLLSSRVRGEARETAKTHVAVAEEALATGRPVEPPAVVLSGGETTVSVDGEGRGGPNQEFAVSCAVELSDDAVAVASVDTDGYDGSTDVAGALVDADALDPDAGRRALDANDTYPILDRAGAHLATGETGTNVNDLRVLVVDDSS